MEELKGKEQAKRLKDLGLAVAAQALETEIEFKRKTVIAYEHFRYVTPEKITDFNNKIKEKTHKDHGNGYSTYSTYDRLEFVNLGIYGSIPPENVLQDLEKAKSMNCFDKFEIAKISSVEVRPDPILFGVIEGCPDRFYISQWDNDVSIEDILQENEG